MKGQLGFVSKSGESVTGHLLHGTSLKKNSETLSERPEALKGEVVATRSQTTGDATHSLLVRFDGEVPKDGFKLAQIDLVTLEKEGLLRVDLTHEPGFVRNKNESLMIRFPGWRIQAVPTVTLQ